MAELKKLFPIYPGPGLCVPKGICCICQQLFIEIEPVGYTKPKNGPGRYYHARCLRGS